jgi:hypothetical protein
MGGCTLHAAWCMSPPPVNAEAAPVVGAHELQALHPWQGMDTDQDHSLVLRTDICSVA